MLTLGYRSPDTSAGNLSVPSGQQVGVETCQRIAGNPVHIPNVHCGSPPNWTSLRPLLIYPLYSSTSLEDDRSGTSGHGYKLVSSVVESRVTIPIPLKTSSVEGQMPVAESFHVEVM
ncbi:hypothetical protein TNCV_3610091 [Trichonephila clavipes]|nr:hypothetical protein TNCV_3610091 [Trichonephila clavipes]